MRNTLVQKVLQYDFNILKCMEMQGKDEGLG